MAIEQTPQYWIKNIAIIGVVAILAACGGGGGNSSSDSGSGSSSGNGSGSGSVTPPPVQLDVTPDNFVFEAKNDAIPGETYTSNTITVSGINAAVPVSVSGGEYAIDDGAFTAAPATVKPGQTIVVRATAAPTPVSIVNAVLTIGGVTGTYSITTLADETAPTAEFMFPPPVSMTDGATVLVRGVASDDYSEITAVTVNDVAVETTDNFATWQVEVPLASGDNKLVVKTTDAVGNPSANAAEVMVRRGAITEAFPDADYEFDGVVDFVIDRLDGRNRLITVGGVSSKVISVDLMTGKRTSFSINPSPFGSEYAIGIALDEQAKEVFFRGENTILAQPLDGGTSREGSDIRLSEDGLVCIVDNLDGELRLVFSNSDSGAIVVTDSALSEFKTLSSAVENIPNTDNPITGSSGMALDSINGRYLVTNLDTQAIIAVDRTTGARSIFSSNTVGRGDSFAVSRAGITGIAIDNEKNRALVVEAGTGKVFAISLNTGDRTIITDSSVENSGIVMSHTFGIRMNSTNSYAFVADLSLEAIVAVDLMTGHRVVFSKSAATP